MNKELELEALKYENSFEGGAAGTEAVDFIAGATSKYVEKQKLEFAIEQLKSLGQIHDEQAMSQRIRFKIKQLEERLKELENN